MVLGHTIGCSSAICDDISGVLLVTLNCFLVVVGSCDAITAPNPATPSVLVTDPSPAKDVERGRSSGEQVKSAGCRGHLVVGVPTQSGQILVRLLVGSIDAHLAWYKPASGSWWQALLEHVSSGYGPLQTTHRAKAHCLSFTQLFSMLM